MAKLKKVFITFVAFACLGLSFSPKSTYASNLSQQITTDLIGAGISISAALSGNTAIALSAGLLTKYVTTYGVGGVKKLIELYKGAPPRDITEVNLYYVYLINAKRNLYYTLTTMANSQRALNRDDNFHQSMDEVISNILGLCENNCSQDTVDESFVNFQFVSLALDARATLDVDRVLSFYQFKHTFQYLMLLYADIQYIEQMLMESINDVLIERVISIRDLLATNVYLSKEEKNFLMSVVMNIETRFHHLKQKRRVVLFELMSARLENSRDEANSLQDQLDDYQRRNGQKSKKGLQRQLDDLISDLSDLGTEIDPFSTNPLQTGSTLQNYYMSEKLLLLNRDTLFKFKANKLESTEDVADYAHRLSVMKSHSNNIMRQLFNVIKEHASGNYLSIGEWSQRQALQTRMEDLIKQCEEDAACVNSALGDAQLSINNVLVQNLELAGIIFKEIPAMHSTEVMSTYQLISLMQLEIIYGQVKLMSVEYELFNNKQQQLIKAIKNNPFISELEKDLQVKTLENVLKKWKIKILDRKFNHKEEFENQMDKFVQANIKLKNKSEELEQEFRDVLKLKECKTTIFNTDRARCKLRKKFIEFKKSLFNNNFRVFESTNITDEFFGGEQ